MSRDAAARRPEPERGAPRVLVVDNYDSFAYNLVQYVGEVVVRLGGTPDDVLVRRNDAVDVDDVRALDPDGVVVSPGPGTPAEAGVSVPIFDELDYPTLGVCLGHQALCAANGAPVGHAEAVVHGKASTVVHDGEGLFAGLPASLSVGRYHSLAVERDALPDALELTAWTEGEAPDNEAGSGRSRTPEDEVVMAVRHRERPHVGVQFHPESILTDGGKRLVENFCQLCSTT